MYTAEHNGAQFPTVDAALEDLLWGTVGNLLDDPMTTSMRLLRNDETVVLARTEETGVWRVLAA